MASVLDGLAARAGEKIGDGKWVDSVVSSAKKELVKLPSDVQPLASAALDKMAANKDSIAGVSQFGFTAIVSRMALGQDDAARMIYLRDSASVAERLAALDDASADTVKERAARDEAWETTKSVAKEMLMALGKAAIPLLLAAI
jgi:hypothetical protein